MAKKPVSTSLFSALPVTVIDVEVAEDKSTALLRLSDGDDLRLSTTALAICELKNGSPVDGRVRGEVVRAELVASAVKKAVRLLAASPKTTGELAERLVAKGMTEEIAQRAVAYLQARGMLDDRAIAERISQRKSLSTEGARQAMESRKIGPKIIDVLLKHGESDQERAVNAARRIDATLPPSLSPSARRRRLLSGLARRGFERETAEAAADHVAPFREEAAD